MRAFLLAAALAAALAPLPALAADPPGLFDQLFGSKPEPERLDAGKADQAGRDDLIIASLRLSREELLSDLSVYKLAEGPCLALAPMLAALEVEHRQVGDATELKFYRPERVRTVAPQQLRQTPDGPCLPVGAWGGLISAKVVFDPVEQRVTLTDADLLPVAERLEREAQRKLRLAQVAPPAPRYPEIANPWRVAAWPTLDIAASATLTGARLATSLTAEGSGDLALATARWRVSRDTSGRIGFRGHFERNDDTGLPLGPVLVRQFQAGDIGAPSQPLLADGQQGRGLVISTRPGWRAELFDQVDLSGPLPPGWQAELYRDNELLGVVEAPDSAGEYRFRAVPLRLGSNRYVVRRYGPHGERDEQPFVRVIGAERYAENETYVTLGVIEPGTPLVGPADSIAGGPSLFATVEHGFTPTLSGRFDLRRALGGGTTGLGASLNLSLLGGVSSLAVAKDSPGRPALSLRGARRFGGTDIRFEIADYGAPPPTSTAPTLRRDLARMATLAASTRLAIGRLIVPVEIGLRRALERGGVAVSEVDQSASLAVGQARLSNRLGLQWREAPAQGGAVGAQSFTALGQFGAGVDTHGWRLRGTLDYRLAPAVQPLVAALSVARGRSRFSWSMDLGYDMAAHKALLGLGASTRLGPLDLGVQGSVSGGLWRIGLTSRFSLYHAPVGGYRLGLAGMSNTASLLPEVAMADNAAPIADTRFIVDNSLRPEETDAAGVARISGLSAGRPITIAPQASSLPDDRLRPVEKGATIRLRPGQVTPLTFHVAPTGEIEARIVSRNGDAVTPLPGEVVELLAADGTARKAMSDFDGFAYYDGVAYGTYTLRCANCAAASLDLTVDEGHSFVSGKVLTVVPPGAATP